MDATYATKATVVQPGSGKASVSRIQAIYEIYLQAGPSLDLPVAEPGIGVTRGRGRRARLAPLARCRAR
jgi:hypothetical protein